MRIIPLGADSLGTRSFSFYVETEDIKIVIDPACALAPRRNSYPPTPLEIKVLNETYQRIRDYVLKSDLVIITHYHNDHYPFFDTEIFKEKYLLLKNYKQGMNHMQIVRARKLISDLKKVKVFFDFCDNKKYKFGKTEIIFSEPLWHGKAKKQGRCVSLIVKTGKELSFFSSDTQGLWEEKLKKFIKNQNNIKNYFIDGPSLYQSRKEDIKEFIDDIEELLKKDSDSKVIIDHHFVRDLSYKSYIEKLKKIFGENRIFTCAQFLGGEDNPLESKRREYYEGKNF